MAKGAAYDECIENIDIGGPAMIRAAAKNHAGVTVVVEPGGLRARAGRDARRTAGRRRSICASSSPPRPMPARRPTMRRSAAGSPRRSAMRRPSGARSAAGCAHAAALRREPASVGGLLCHRATRAPASPPPCSTRARSCPTTTSTTPTRPSSWSPSSPRARPAVAIIKHANPCGVATGATLEGGLSQGAALRSGERLRRHRRAQRHHRRRGRRGDRQDLHRGGDRAATPPPRPRRSLPARRTCAC